MISYIKKGVEICYNSKPGVSNHEKRVGGAVLDLNKLAAYNYHLPDGFIAQEPACPRDQAKLLVLRKNEARVEHTVFSKIGSYLMPGTVMVINDTKVIPARLFGKKEPTGGNLEVLLLKQRQGDLWEVLLKGKVREGTRFIIKEGMLQGEVLQRLADSYLVRFEYHGCWDEVLAQVGEVPLPPYIKSRRPTDQDDYQTVYANHQGAVAAPTAGLHFTPELLLQLEKNGIIIAPITLHIGRGTFAPVTAADITQHQFAPEYFQLPATSHQRIMEAKKAGNPILAVGTSSTRVLETIATENGFSSTMTGWSKLFIFPEYQFKTVTALLTNFHLPCSTPLMLVAAFAGYQRTLTAYREAISKHYRFYSYGDAMLIL